MPDRVHAIRLVDYHFLGCWREIDPTGAKNRGLMFFMRRRRRELKPQQRTKPGVYKAKAAACNPGATGRHAAATGHAGRISEVLV